MTDHIFFILGLSLLLVHEMDAIRCKEWKMFPGLSLLDDKTGYIVFVAAHLPLLVFILYGLLLTNVGDFAHAVSYFLIVHFGLHLLFLKHKNNGFKDIFSWLIISGASLCGLLHLTL